MSYQPGYQSPITGYVPTADERTWGMLAHLSAFAGCLFPVLGHIGGPLLVLLFRGDNSPYVSYHAREALNFNISVVGWYIVSGLLCLILIGIPMLVVVFICSIVLPILAALKARDGYGYRYPMTLRLIPER
jgi:uncharacterized Tic20 family protein